MSDAAAQNLNPSQLSGVNELSLGSFCFVNFARVQADLLARSRDTGRVRERKRERG